jgi:PAS domain S-box-containing protein
MAWAKAVRVGYWAALVVAVGLAAAVAANLIPPAAREAWVLLFAGGLLVVGLGDRLRRTVRRSREADGTLRQTVAQLQLFVENAPAAIAMLDRELRYVVVSRRFLADYHLGERDLRGLGHYDVFPEIPARWKAIHQRCLAGAVERSDEEPFARADGTVDWVKWEIRPWHEASGAIGGIILFTEVVTEQHVAAALVEAERAKLAITLDSIGDAVITTDAEGQVVLINPVAETLTGWRAPEAIGRALAEIFRILGEDSRVPVPNPVSAVLTDGKTSGLANHTLLVARDGTERPIADSAAPIRDGEGKVRGVVLTFRDQSKERASQREVRRSEARYRAMFEQAAFGIANVDPTNGRLLEVNERLAAIFGYTRAELERLDWRDLSHPEDQGGDGSAVAGSPAEGIQRRERRCLRKDGSSLWCSVTIIQFALPGEETETQLAVVDDISGRKQLEALEAKTRALEVENRATREASRLKSEFVASMSHELRTPLNAIIGFAELLHDGQVGPQTREQREFTGDVLSAGRHLLRLVSDVLDLAKLEARRMSFYPEPIQVADVVAEVAATLHAVAAAKRIALTCDVEPRLGSVVTDPSRLKQLLYNYASNAIKFTPIGGEVLLRVQGEGDRFRVEVADTGPGIAPADLGKLFTPFSQLGEGDRTAGGTGLGLALTKELVEAQGGSVGVTSVIGSGSTFYALLPRGQLTTG